MWRAAALAALVIWPGAALAQTVRIATYNTALSEPYASAMLRKLSRNDDAVAAVVSILAEVAPDIVLLNEFDHDPQGHALAAIQVALEEAGHPMPHAFIAPVNSGELTGFDLDGDGSVTGPDDAHGYGRWPGHYGMAVLSRFPIGATRTFQTMRWRDLTDHRIPSDHYETEVAEILRLSSKSHWDVEILTPGITLNMLASHPTPPVFDGPEDANGRRNADEIAFWRLYLDGEPFRDDTGREASFAGSFPVVLGDLNADPFDGDGLHEEIAALLTHPALQDPRPSASTPAARQTGVNAQHAGDPALDTADWNDERGPGNLRVDYVLPSARLDIAGAGIFWPAPGQPLAEAAAFSDHRLVWVDIRPAPASD